MAPVESKNHCPAGAIEAKITGSVTKNGSLPAGDPGVKSPVKAFVCAIPTVTGYQLSLAKGSLKS